MKKILLGFLVLLTYSIMGYAQPPVLYFDFEGAVEQPSFTNVGATWNGIVANPLKDAVNGSDSVGSSTTGANGWDGIAYYFPQNLDLRVDTIFSILVYSPTYTGRTRLQFEGTGMGAQKLQNDGYMTAGEWKELSFPIPSKYDNRIYRVLIIFDDAKTRTEPQTWYFMS
jgi:hypothetical protein